jgi:molecular chaperone DnaK (HSP70)
VRVAAVTVERADDDGARVLRAAMEALADKVIVELRDVIHQTYSSLFMQVIVSSLIAVAPASPLKLALTAVSI